MCWDTWDNVGLQKAFQIQQFGRGGGGEQLKVEEPSS